MNWYCITTNPNCQRRAEAGLAAKGYRVFWPRVRKWATHARTRVAKEYPLLWTYLFVQVGEGQSFGEVRTVDGVEQFLDVAGEPIVVPSKWVENLLLRYLDGEWDHVRPEPVYYFDPETGEEKIRINPPIPVGAKIRLMEGEFADMLATVVNRLKGNRLRVVPQGQYKPLVTREQNARAA